MNNRRDVFVQGGSDVKRILAAAAAMLTLCSCSLNDEPELSSDVSEETTTFVFTGVPEIPTFKAPSGSETVTSAVTDVPADETVSPEESESLPAEGTGSGELVCLDVPYFSQEEYPTGCELVCASMLLAYYGFEISPAELIEQGYVGTGSVTEDFMNPGTYFGDDPNKVFIGDPNDIFNFSYGCYSGAIFAGLRKYLAHEYYDAANLSGISLKDLCMEYIDRGEPVLIWASTNMEPTHSEENNTWTITDTGETFTWISNEHCLVLIGYDDENYCFHDPQSGEKVLYPKAVSEQRYRELGKQAITVHPW